MFTRKEIIRVTAGVRNNLLFLLRCRRRHKFQTLLKTEASQRDFSDPDNKSLLMSMMMTSCDLSQTTKPWDAQYQVPKLDDFC